MGQWFTGSLLPEWEKVNEQDNLVLLKALGVAQENVPLVLACIQSQGWVQTIVAAIIQEGDSCTLPDEILKIV